MKENKLSAPRIIIIIIMIIIIALMYYINPMSISQVGFWTMPSIIVGIVCALIIFLKSIGGNSKRQAKIEGSGRVLKIICIVIVAANVIVYICGVFSGPLFHAKKYSKIADIEVSENLDIIPTLDDLNRISLMDTNSATRLGNRQLGKMNDLVSQFEVSDIYYTINYNGGIYKVAPLEYGGFFKWANNDSIPGYVIVNPTDNTAKYVAVEGGIKYSPSAYFGEDLFRYSQMHNIKEKLYFAQTTNSSGTPVTTYSFQLDESGKPYWVIPTYEYAVGIKGRLINGAIIMDASTGEMSRYEVNEIPAWVDLVYAGPVLTNYYDLYGRYNNGYFNFSEVNETETTSNYGYLMIDEDIYIYTGVTSVAGDESNIGFIIGNTRTGKITMFMEDGAEEYSAMSAAEGVVKNYGYNASFPSLVMVGDTPTYVMVLKDDAGLVKRYAMVSMKNYSIAVAGNDIDSTLALYNKALQTGGVESEGAEAAALEGITDISYSAKGDVVYVTITFADGSVETYQMVEENAEYEYEAE